MGKINRKEFLSFKSTESDTGIKEYPYVDPSNKDLPRSLQKTSTGVSAYAGTFGDAEIMHLLRRTLFGATKADLDFFKTKTLSEAVDYLLTVPTTAPNPPLNHYGLNPNQNDPDVPYGSTWVNAPNNPLLNGARIQSIKFWWTGLLLNQERNIQEKMTLFWHNHFSTEMITVQDSRFSYKHHAMLRANCLGNFKSLVKMITTDSAMLVYLNGEKNGKTAPDENYGRELQELFTIGKDLPNHYTEQDVKEAARVLTGWRNNRGTGVSFFDSTQHDTGNKTFSSFYGNTVITGRSGLNAGNLELDDLLTMIFAQQEVSKYICRKIYRYFVYYLIDETVEANVISPLATILRNNSYDIKPVLETLFKSEHFFDPLNRACMIKSPMDHIIGLCRSTQIQFPDSTSIQTQYGHYQLAQQYGLVLSQDIGDPPNVAGWPAYYQEPQYTELWINSDSLPKRNTLCDAMVYTGVTRFGFKLIMDCIALANNTSIPANPNTLLIDLVKILYPMELSSTTLNFLKTSFLLSGQSTDTYWTDAWNAYIANPSNTVNKAAVNTRLQALLKYLFGQAEYQLC
ncbi:MAG: DUF1800 domain-containing protein [Bacteroidia bacterium]|nr:DUF1800 domain-containing protein [Bacteroidia bacterium]MCF8425284.1 DUF1800 domain-containing protein [Bacteroidia bacterium]MCF8446590.1 DUF1800 domain-containing protein [Bacteroidia bacterium]